MGEIFLVEFGRKFQDEHENVRHLTTANWIMAQADFERPHAGCDEMMGERRKGKGCDCWRFYANEMTGLMGEEHNKRGKTAFPQIFRKRTRLQEEKEMKTVYLVCSWNISSICSFIQKKKNVGPTRSASLMFHDKKWDRRSKKKKEKRKEDWIFFHLFNHWALRPEILRFLFGPGVYARCQLVSFPYIYIIWKLVEREEGTRWREGRV